MKKVILLLAVICSFIVLSQSAFAEGMFQINDIENKNGSIGLYIYNDYSTPLYTDPSETNRSVLKYYVDNEAVSIISSKSAGTIPAGSERFVVLDKAWPESGYNSINITFIDDAGTVYPTHTTAVVFTKEGLTRIDADSSPERATTDDNIVLKVKIKADGENDISNIRTTTKNPSYLIFESEDVPTYISKGQTKEFTFNYKPSGGSLADTVIYTTSRPLINITYSYLGQEAVLELNESVIIFNKLLIGDKLPNVTAWLEMPEEAVPGSKINVSAFAHNLNSGGHSACSLNFSLSSDTSGISISIHTILPGEKLLGTLVEPIEPMVTFEVTVGEGTSLGTADFTLKTTYKDCEWNAPFKTEATGSMQIVESIEEPEEDVEEELNETTNETTEEIEEETEDEKQIEVRKPFRESAPLQYYLILGLTGFGIIILVVAALEWRSRFI